MFTKNEPHSRLLCSSAGRASGVFPEGTARRHQVHDDVERTAARILALLGSVAPETAYGVLRALIDARVIRRIGAVR
jgi:hypothetical protein